MTGSCLVSMAWYNWLCRNFYFFYTLLSLCESLNRQIFAFKACSLQEKNTTNAVPPILGFLNMGVNTKIPSYCKANFTAGSVEYEEAVLFLEFLAFLSALFDRSSWTVGRWPFRAANIKDVILSPVRAAFTFAPLSIKRLAISKWPPSQAHIKEVIPLCVVAAFTTAPLSINNRAISRWP